MPPVVPGSVNVTDAASVSGAFNDTELILSLSCSTNLFESVPLPAIVTLPADLIVAPLILPVVSIVVAPPIKELPLMVPEAMTGLARVLLLSVAVPLSVTTTPVLGNTAFEVIPVPPSVVGRMPVTAAERDKLIAPKVGTPPPLGTTKLWKAAPGAVENKLPASLPSTTPLLAKLVEPVPPLLTPITPEPMIDAGSDGMSATTKLVPTTTRPLASTCNFV